MSTILAISAGIAVLAVPVMFFLFNRKKNKQEEPEKPIEQPEPQQPEPIEEPVEQPTEHEPQPVEPIEEPVEPKPEPTEEPIEPEPEEPAEPEDPYKQQKEEIIEYFSKLVEIGPKTKEYLMNMPFDNNIPEDLFPKVIDYYGNYDNQYATEQYFAWLFAMILAELEPIKRNDIYELGYNYKIAGAKQNTYGWKFNSDPNIMRIWAAKTYSTTRDESKIAELREEVGGDMLTYKDEIDECYVNTCSFMPFAPGPSLDGWAGYMKDSTRTEDGNLKEDQAIHDYVSKYYSLDTKDTVKRQETIQAIADKEGEVQHLLGKPRTVKDPKYGEMTLYPVFGKHNIGIEIPDDGAIAKLVSLVAPPCSSTRKTLLKQEYGRRRPGQGKYDNTRNDDPAQRVLVNYTIEEGDGYTTGYYNKDGDYIDSNGNHIGDYETYFQKFLFANSYPSGHSGIGIGAGLILMEVMPDRADKILKAANQFAVNRTIARYHWNSDTIQGRIIATTMIPVLHSITNIELDKMIEAAKKEYKKLLKAQNKS